MTLARSLLLAVALTCLASLSLTRAETPAKRKEGPVSYYREVRRLFQQHCQGCHQPAKALGGYTMTAHADLLKAGDKGQPNVVPGNPEKSFLISQIRPHAGKKALMPKNRDPLTPAEIELVRKWIAEGARDDTPKSARDVVSEKNPPVYRLPPVVPSLAYSPDGKMLAVAGFHEVLLHKGDGAEPAARLIGLSERIQSLAFSPDGARLAVAGGSPGRFGEVQVWDVAKKRLDFSVSSTFDTLYGVSWSPDGKKIAFGCADNTLRGIDAENGKQILQMGSHTDWVLGSAFTQDGEHLVSVSRDMSLRLTVVKTQRFVDNVTSITPGGLKGGLQAVAVRPGIPRREITGVQGKVIYDEALTGGSDGVPRLYQVHRTKQRRIGDDDNRLREYAKMPGRIFTLAFNKNGTQFAAGSSLDGQGEVRVYQTADGKLVSKVEKVGPVYTVAFHPEGNLMAAAGFDGKVRIIEAATGKVLREFIPVPIATSR